ncbi:GNAT family N-acetyltransferase [Rhodohalobacter halophilus]|uniref:GNAT family N-acetyltransferase n=1 Tax=Rhodohalobacter halophilus TaxID=1812810 RepID=UPI00083FA552|nr:GNAT family N-acyltransferase [Rhodohalobacter halophilus]
MLIKEHVLTDVESQQYTIKFAKTEEEVEEALRLRYRVFKEELGRDFDFKEGVDKDRYDDQSHHLIVVENKTGKIVGTYRMQTFEQAQKGNGFTSEVRFEVNTLPEDVLKNAVEVGRACISKEHRSGRVLFLLWKGFAGYLEHFNKRYLFGYAALDTSNLKIARNTFEYLKKEGHLHPDYYIEPKEEFKPFDNPGDAESKEIEIPPLFKNYLDVGSKVIAGPSFDKKLNLIHFMILLDVEKISDRTRKMFFG